MLKRRFFSNSRQKHNRNFHSKNGYINQFVDADVQRVTLDSDNIYIVIYDTGFDGNGKYLNTRIVYIDSNPL